jgi:hypothetical protein
MNLMKRGKGHGAPGTGSASRVDALGKPVPRINRSPRGSRARCPLPLAPLL